jgi:flagellar hook-length control protein FliK
LTPLTPLISLILAPGIGYCKQWHEYCWIVVVSTNVFRYWNIFMPITIVSALPKSTSSSTASAAAGTENALQDFTSLLLGHLTDAQSDEESILETMPESAANDSMGGGEAGDPLAILAALAQASFEQQGKVASDQFTANDSASGDTDDEAGDSLALLASLAQASLEQRDKIAQDAMTGINAKESPGDENVLLADRMTRKAAQALSADQIRTPANEQAANFAAKLAISSDKVSGEIAPRAQESSGLSTQTIAAAGAPSRQDNASPTIPVPTSVYNRDWNNDFAQKVTWIATHNKQFAELTLNPPNMGNIEISIKLDNDKSTATATFFSSNAEVRETIETSLPRLREMLAGAGIQLGQTHVGAESFRQASGNGQHPGQSPSPSGNDMDILALDPQAVRIAASVVGAGRGMVDMFV